MAEIAKTYELAVEIAGKVDSSFSQSFKSATSVLQESQHQVRFLKKELKELEQNYKSGAISAEQYKAAQSRLTAELNKAEQAQKRLARAIELQGKAEAFQSRMRGKLLGAVAAGATLAVPVKLAIDFESAMADVRKVVDFETPQQFKEMGEDILSLSQRIPMAARGLADIVAAAGQAGIARNELLAFAESAAKMGVAFDITAEQAGQMMAQWRTAFKMSQKEVNELADQINYLGNTTAASAPKISDIVTRIGPLGEIGGATAREIAALGATMVSVGVGEEIAATGIKNLILRLTSGASATKKQQGAFKALGLSATKMAKMMQEDAQGAILAVVNALRKIPEHKRAAVLTDLFGRESVAAIAPLITNVEQLEENLRKVGDATQYAGSMEKEFEARSATTANSLQLLMNTITRLGVTIGSVLLPPLAELAQSVAKVVGKVADWMGKHEGLTKVLIYATSAMLALKIAIAVIGFAFASVLVKLAHFYVWIIKNNVATKIATASTRAWALAQKGLNVVLGLSGKLLYVGQLIAYNVATKAVALGTKLWAAAQWLLNAALSANPIGLVVVAVAGLVAGLTILYKKSEIARAIINTLWDVIGAGPRAIMAVIGKLWDFISVLGKIKIPDVFGKLWSGITGGVSTAIGAAKTVASKIGSIFGGIKIPDVSLMSKVVWDVAKFPFEAISAIPEKITDIMGKIKLPDIWGPFESAAIGAFRAVKEKMSGLIAFLNNIAPISSLGKILDALASGAANAYSFVMDKFSQLLSYLSAIKWPESLGKLWDGLSLATTSAYNFITDKMTSLTAFLDNIVWPSSLGHLWDVLMSGGASAYNFIVEKMDALISFLGGVIWPTSLGSLWDIITSGATSMFQTVINALNWVIDKVNWFIDKLNKIKLPSWLPMVGGKGVNIEMIEQIKAPTAPVPGHAEGGIFSVPHVAMVAERGPEAIMPLDKLLAAMREGGAKAAAPSINITYSPASPVINIYGQGEMNAEQIRSEVLRAERKAQEEFEARLKAFLAQQRRLNYA